MGPKIFFKLGVCDPVTVWKPWDRHAHQDLDHNKWQLNLLTQGGQGREAPRVPESCWNGSSPGRGGSDSVTAQELRERRAQHLDPAAAAGGFSQGQQNAGPELALCQGNGINFPSAGQKGPRDFYFYSVSITTARQHKQGPNKVSAGQSHFPLWGAISVPASC